MNSTVMKRFLLSNKSLMEKSIDSRKTYKSKGIIEPKKWDKEQ